MELENVAPSLVLVLMARTPRRRTRSVRWAPLLRLRSTMAARGLAQAVRIPRQWPEPARAPQQLLWHVPALAAWCAVEVWTARAPTPAPPPPYPPAGLRLAGGLAGTVGRGRRRA